NARWRRYFAPQPSARSRLLDHWLSRPPGPRRPPLRPPTGAAPCRSRREPERWIPIGDQEEGVGNDAVVPADHALDELEKSPGIPAGEQDGEPRDDRHEQRRDLQEEQHDVVRDREQPLPQGPP